jgi:hypothetical protein
MTCFNIIFINRQNFKLTIETEMFNFLQNQSGIYYDVDCEQDVYSGTSKSQHAAIPMSTYTMSSRAPYYRQ